MSISAAVGIAVSGMQAQTKRLAATADNVANASTPGYDSPITSLTTLGTGGVSTSVNPSGEAHPGEDMLDLIEAEIGYRANASAFETGAEIWDVLMSIKRD